MRDQNMNRIFFDSSAWIEYFAGTARGQKIKQLLKPETKVFTTGMIVAEVIAKHLKEGLQTENAMQALRAIPFLVTFESKIGEETAKIYVQQRKVKQKFGLVDAHVVATARAVNAQIITCDLDFSGLSDVKLI